MQTKDSNNKDFFRSKKPKSKDLKSAPSREDMTVKPAKKEDKKNKKKRF